MAEPELEDLSAYLDQQLSGKAKDELEAHLHSCETCRRRLEALKQMVTAIRALPMESPPRVFTVPQVRRPALRWTPLLGWAGGAVAAALLVVIVGNTLIGGPFGGAASRSQGGAAQPARERLEEHAPNQQGYAPTQSGAAPRSNADVGAASFANAASVVDPVDSSRRFTLATDARTYQVSGTLTVRLITQGASYTPSSGLTLDQSGIRLALIRDGYAVDLTSPSQVMSSSTGPSIQASYRISNLPLPGPRAGKYRLVATWSLPNAAGTALVAEVPIELVG